MNSLHLHSRSQRKHNAGTTRTAHFGLTSAIAFFTIMQLSILSAQTTESLTVDEIAPDSADWMAELAKADNFRESANSPDIPSSPYENVNIGRQSSAVPSYHQPQGALTGKITFAMAGHGWTYDSDEMYYYTQRGLSHGMVEDLGNADQMHIFAHLLFNAGATVVPLKPVDHQPNERIIDNTMQQVEFFGPWRAGTSDRFFGNAGDKVPYAVADASLIESAVARYRPYIPEAGYYPVYVWARDGADRSNQGYKIAHSGGVAEVQVDWKNLGKAWVWLGTYYFDIGTEGYVEITNQVIDPYEVYGGHIVIADAVRFGNGRGDVPRPGGISGFLREDEGDSYWIQRSLGVNADRQLYDIGRDGSSTVSSPPKAAAHINRELHGSFLDRILISFHSNASSGKARGAVGLFNASAAKRPTYQESLAQILGEEINIQMQTQEHPFDRQWSDRERDTYSGINFGELRRDYVQNEMCASIIETAFHDNELDVDFLLDPIARVHMAEATLRGVLRWYAEIINPGAPEVMVPARPAAVAALVEEDGIRVKWITGEVGKYKGGPAAEVRIYRSRDGYGFDGGISAVAYEGNALVDSISTSGVTFVRVTAVNSAGESLPSQTVAVGIGSGSDNSSAAEQVKTLHVAVNTVLDRTTNVPYDLGRQPAGPYKPTAQTERVRTVYAMMEPSGVAEALALSALNQVFDGADSAAFEAGLVKRDEYKRLFFTTEQQNPNTSLFSEKLENQLRSFLNRDGKLYISGSGFIDNLSRSGQRHKTFLNDILGIVDSAIAMPRASVQSMDDRFFPTAVTSKLTGNNRFWEEDNAVAPAVLELREGRSIGLLKYQYDGSDVGVAAALTRPSYSEGEIITLSFPLSLIQQPKARTALMQAILKQL